MSNSKWRETYKVHPAANVFPMMSDEELDALGADIKANGLTIPVLFWRNGKGRALIDGRNRLDPTPDIRQLVDEALLGDIPECRDRRRRS